MTLKVASIYKDILAKHSDEPIEILSLENKVVWERGPEMVSLEQQYLVPAQRFIFIMPEYNASFPGILKLMLDNSDIKNCWYYKKAALVGLSDGRAGNLRGLEHMTAILHYMKVHVLYNKVILSKVSEEISKQGAILKPETEALLLQQIEDFLKF